MALITSQALNEILIHGFAGITPGICRGDVSKDQRPARVCSNLHISTRADLSRGGPLRSSAVQRQNAVSAYFTSEQILPFGFAGRGYCVGQQTCGCQGGGPEGVARKLIPQTQLIGQLHVTDRIENTVDRLIETADHMPTKNEMNRVFGHLFCAHID